MNKKDKLKLSLLCLRLSVFVVMLVWVLDKFLNPDHAARVFAKFYMIPNLNEMASYVMGSAQGLILLGFLLGFKKKYTYSAIFLMHLVSTGSSWMMYMQPFKVPNILFWAAFPMLAACFTLWLMREDDTLFTIGR